MFDNSVGLWSVGRYVIKGLGLGLEITMSHRTKPTMSLSQLEKVLGEGRIIPGREKVIGELKGMVRFMKGMSDGRTSYGDNKGFGRSGAKTPG